MEGRKTFAVWKLMFVTPADSEYSAAFLRMSSLISVAVTWPSGMYFAKEAVIVPEPAPMSSKLSLGFASYLSQYLCD